MLQQIVKHSGVIMGCALALVPSSLWYKEKISVLLLVIENMRFKLSNS